MTARILVVDDISTNIKVLEAKLTSEYYEVITAGSGPEALEAAVTQKPDLILLDVMMPGMDGFEVCRRLKADSETAHIPVIMVTALGDPEDRVQGLSAGADDFLTKPVDDVAMFARVRSLLRVKLMLDELRMRERTSATLGVISPPVPNVHEDYASARLLVVEDNPRDQVRLQRMIEGQFQIEMTADGAEALVRARNAEYDSVVISLALQNPDGLRLCSQFRTTEETRNVPILLLVGPDDQRQLVKGLEIGVTDYVVRPIDRNEFIARLRAQVRRKRYQDRLRLHYQQSIEMAVTDSLTGLYNRRYMASHLATLLDRASQRGTAVLILDLDYFKQVNDTHGHQAGDEVLREIGNRIVRNIRGIDMACRYGGEEFVVLMPDTDIDSAEVVANRLLQAIGGKPVPVRDAGELTVTCSIGCTASAPGDTAESLLKRADDALYEAKNGGRNRIIYRRV
ncbi:MAG TPA: PleD family two-component system response regulator [Ferrovibrio sp.]|jgi:two-component system cell cycle response regulator|uniref:PleD family two-component system response regulator n=1 Tax=Ferrovibrio sp. TaxID=1917215 RepID=UPI002B4AF660|nr:PleD family two-component system response regulator [Ferrovibrio sp.]HLT78919.1 PleD family two-component system response regulator [Ferrovibrio sp.]